MNSLRRIRCFVAAASLLACLLTFASRGSAQPATDETQPSAGGAEAAAEVPPRQGARTAVNPDSSVEEILVTGTSVTEAIDQERFSESVVNVLTAKDFAVTGDTGVVEALSRVTGVTTVDNKYVYVRGLGERYSSVQFNGALLPSPDPTRRVVPLDLFPASAMQQLVVQKTYSPDLPADFAGGSVQLQTRGIPAEREARMSLSSDVRTNTTFTSRTWYDGSSTDWTGFDGGYRHLPDPMPGDIQALNKMTAQERQGVGLTMKRGFDTGNQILPPNFKLKGGYGNAYDLHVGSVGFLLGWQAENDWEYRHERWADYRSSGNVFNFGNKHKTTNSTQYSGLATGQWEPSNGHSLSATAFFTQNTDKRYIDSQAWNAENYVWGADERSEWEQESLWTLQVGGVDNFSRLHDLGVDWGLTYARAQRQKPDTRLFHYDVPYSDIDHPEDTPQFDQKVLSPDANGNQWSWENLTDDAWDAHLNLEFPIRITDSVTTTLKVGARYFDKQRDSRFRKFRFNLIGSHDWNNTGRLPISDLFSDPNISPSFWDLQEVTLLGDLYEAEEEIMAGFVQTETELGSHLRLMAGGRYETARQVIDQTVAGTSFVLKNDGFRPAVELTWILRDGLQLRGAFSQTINRPDLREIAPVLYRDPEDDEWYTGNANLTTAELNNYDLRLEWYHDGPNYIQVAGFYKDITKPIEQYSYNPTATRRNSWANAKSAVVAGAEAELRQGLAPLGRWAEDFYVRSNASYIYSEAEASSQIALITNRRHQLQGQPEWIFNAQLTWENLPTDTEATVAFNMVGEYIKSLGIAKQADTFEQPRPALDFIYRHGLRIFGEDMDLTFKAKNLLDPRYDRQQSGNSVDWYRKGRTFTIEIGKDF